MTTAALIKKLNKEVEVLKKEMREMKQMISVPVRDPEGEYKKSFIKKMVAREQSNGPFYRFIDKASFLRHVRSDK